MIIEHPFFSWSPSIPIAFAKIA